MAETRSVLERPIAPTPSLEDREWTVLAELAREGDARVGFQGLRRRLDLHQQALVRVLRRLAQRGFVARDPSGYRLTDQGFAILRDKAPAQSSTTPLAILSVALPNRLAPETVVDRLAHRWFRGLRWYGLSGGPGEATLTWLTEPDQGLIRLRIRGSSLTLDLEPKTGLASPDIAVAQPVLAAIAELYGLAPPQPDATAACAQARSWFAA